MDISKAIALWDETEKALHQRESMYNANPRSKWVDPFKIFGNLYYVGDQVVSCHLLETLDGLILFDTAFPFTADLLIERIRMLGFKPEHIKHIIHTHEHIDHIGATYDLIHRFGALTYLHKDAAETFRIHPHHTEIQSSKSPNAALFVPDIEIDNGDILNIGDIEISCLHTPGHSAGATSFFFNLKEGKRSVSVGLCGINGTLTLHAGRLFKYGIPLASRDQYVASIKKLRDMDIDITLDTHPRPEGILVKREAQLVNPSSNPFIDKMAWNKTLDDYEERFKAFLEQESLRLED